MPTKHCGYELFLTDAEIRTNCTISFYRQRVEQVNVTRPRHVTDKCLQVIKVIKSHTVFRDFRRGTRMLHAVMCLTAGADTEDCPTAKFEHFAAKLQ